MELSLGLTQNIFRTFGSQIFFQLKEATTDRFLLVGQHVRESSIFPQTAGYFLEEMHGTVFSWCLKIFSFAVNWKLKDHNLYHNDSL